MATNVTREITASSDNVIATSLRGVIERILAPDDIVSVVDETKNVYGATSVSIAVPRGQRSESVLAVGLNETASQRLVDGLNATVLTAIDEAKKPKPRQSIPTAEYVTTTSFKVDQKLVVRVVPGAMSPKRSQKSSVADDNDPAMIWERFSLQAVAEDDQERYQLHETFEGEVLYLFGRRPRIWTFQGIVLNGRRAPTLDDDSYRRMAARRLGTTEDRVSASQLDAERGLFARRRNMDFANELLRRYEKYYRGTRAVERWSRTYLAYDDVLIEGTLLGMVASRNSQIPGAVNVSFTIVVHARTFYGDGLDLDEKETLASLLKRQEQSILGQKVLASAVVPPAPGVDQLRTRLADGEEEFKASQARLTALEDERKNVDTALSSSTDTAKRQALESQLKDLDAEIAGEKDTRDNALAKTQALRATVEGSS